MINEKDTEFINFIGKNGYSFGPIQTVTKRNEEASLTYFKHEKLEDNKLVEVNGMITPMSILFVLHLVKTSGASGKYILVVKCKDRNFLVNEKDYYNIDYIKFDNSKGYYCNPMGDVLITGYDQLTFNRFMRLSQLSDIDHVLFKDKTDVSRDKLNEFISELIVGNYPEKAAIRLLYVYYMSKLDVDLEFLSLLVNDDTKAMNSIDLGIYHEIMPEIEKIKPDLYGIYNKIKNDLAMIE